MTLAQQRQRRQLRRLLALVLALGTLPFVGRLLAAVVMLAVLGALYVVEARERPYLRARCPGCDQDRPTARDVLECPSCGITVR